MLEHEDLTQKNVRKFFEIYESKFKKKINSQTRRLFHVDETGMTVVQHKNKVTMLKEQSRTSHLAREDA
jgi:hypothetical protein